MSPRAPTEPSQESMARAERVCPYHTVEIRHMDSEAGRFSVSLLIPPVYWRSSEQQKKIWDTK
jgi:hypothetical protein